MDQQKRCGCLVIWYIFFIWKSKIKNCLTLSKSKQKIKHSFFSIRFSYEREKKMNQNQITLLRLLFFFLSSFIFFKFLFLYFTRSFWFLNFKWRTILFALLFSALSLVIFKNKQRQFFSQTSLTLPVMSMSLVPSIACQISWELVKTMFKYQNYHHIMTSFQKCWAMTENKNSYSRSVMID